MSMELTCPVCGSVNGFTEEHGGAKGTCGKCSVPLYVPRQEEMPSDAEMRRIARGHSGRGGLATLFIGVLALLLLAGAGVGFYVYYPSKPANAAPLKDPFSAAQAIKVNAAPASHEGALARSGDEVIFRFKASAAGNVSVLFDAGAESKLDGLLHAYDAQKKEITHNDGDPDTRTSQIVFPVKNEQEYFVKLTGFDASAGKYKLTFQNSASLASDFANAQKVRLSRTGSAIRTWRMERAGDENMFEIIAPVSGWMFAEIGNPPEGNLDGFLTAFDDAKNMILSEGVRAVVRYEPKNTILPQEVRSVVRVAVQKGKTYYVKASAHSQPLPGWSRSGPYTLSFRTVQTAADDFGNDFSAAYKLTLDPSAPPTQPGQIENDLDVDVFVFQAPKTGSLKISLVPGLGSSLQVLFSVHDASKKSLLTSPPDYRTYPVVGGQTYYVKVFPAVYLDQGRSRTGAYSLQLSYDNASNNSDFTTAQQVNFFGNQASASGQIVDANQGRYFKFVAPKTGFVKVDLDFPIGSSLDATVSAHNLNTTQINNAGALDSFVDLAVTANQTYYLKVNSKSQPEPGLLRTGGFTLKIFLTPKTSSADTGFDNAKTVSLDTSGVAEVLDQISDPSSAKLFRLMAPHTGVMKVDLVMPAASKLSARLTCFDASNMPIGSPVGSVAPIDFPVSAGKVYFVKVAPPVAPPAGSEKTGSFTAKFRFEKRPGSGSSEFDGAKLIALSAAGTGEIADQISEGPKYYRLVPPKAGVMTVSLEIPESSKLDARINAYDAEHFAVGQGSGPTAIDFSVGAGKTYYVKILPQISPREGFEDTGGFKATFQLGK